MAKIIRYGFDDGLTDEERDQLRKTSLCVSGHRPEKLPHKGNLNLPVIRAMKSVFDMELMNNIKAGYTRFYIGGARGIDLWAYHTLFGARARGAAIEIIAAIPYENFDESYDGTDKWLYGNLIEYADEVVYLYPEYSRSCFQKRNEYMVDHSSKLVAVINSYKSGTANTIRYAEKSGIEVRVIHAGKFVNQLENL